MSGDLDTCGTQAWRRTGNGPAEPQPKERNRKVNNTRNDRHDRHNRHNRHNNGDEYCA